LRCVDPVCCFLIGRWHERRHSRAASL
jgi:hypothetical protein